MVININNKIPMISSNGDIVISASTYRSSFSSVTGELIDDYHIRLMGLPPIQSATISGSLISALTLDNKIILISDYHPQGLNLELNIPNIRKVLHSDPITILDVDNALHQFNMRNIHRKGSYIDQEDHVSIENVTDVCNGYDCNIDNGNFLVLSENKINHYPASIIYDYPSSLLKHTFKIVNTIDRYLIDELGTIYSISLNNKANSYLVSLARVDYKVVDIIKLEYDNCLYTLDYYSIVRKHQRSSIEIVECQFHPLRFINIREEIILIEDIDGNAYTLPDLVPYKLPVRLFNNDVNSGRNMKSARKT